MKDASNVCLQYVFIVIRMDAAMFLLLQKQLQEPHYSEMNDKMGRDERKPVFGGLGTSKVQTSLHIRTVRSEPLYKFAYWNVSYPKIATREFSIF